ncbi:MAG: hypothetical protein LLG40_13855 [Deltaproteobacteria bacterium]|nr:hypothetical protein [Deltaproteobacteria bacterium]
MKKETAKMIFEGGKNAEMLVAIADIMDKEIFIHRAGENSAADVVKCGNSRYILSPRISDNDDQVAGPWEMTYNVCDDGRVAWVWIGHQVAGPCYQRGTDGKWCNCYSRGNFGKNYSSGGNWSSGPRSMRYYDTLDECIAGRVKEIEYGQKSEDMQDKIFLHYAVVPAAELKLI